MLNMAFPDKTIFSSVLNFYSWGLCIKHTITTLYVSQYTKKKISQLIGIENDIDCPFSFLEEIAVYTYQ